MKRQIALGLALLLGVMVAAGCRRGVVETPSERGARSAKLSRTAYQNVGRSLNMIVDVRSARLAGQQEFLPLQIAILNKGMKGGDLRLTRESLVLENRSGTQLPVVQFEEFIENYRRQNADFRTGRNFLETLEGRYPSPQFLKRALEFFPLRNSARAPRQEIVLRPGQMAVGFVYFRIPEGFSEDRGEFKLLYSPGGESETYVVDLDAYRAPEAK